MLQVTDIINYGCYKGLMELSIFQYEVRMIVSTNNNMYQRYKVPMVLSIDEIKYRRYYVPKLVTIQKSVNIYRFNKE